MQSWTADGKWIYFGLFGKGEPRMGRISPDGSHFEEVGKGIDPAVSPGGKTVAFARALPDGHHLFCMDADGSNVRQLTAKGNAYAGVHCTWAPDGKTILYADQVKDALEIFSIEADGKNARQLTRLGQAATTPAVSADMKWISFRLCDEIYWRDGRSSERAYRERRADKRPVWVMSFDGSNPHVIESLHYQTTIDGSRAPWQPRPAARSYSGASSNRNTHGKLATTSDGRTRDALWQALTRSLPKHYRQIDAFAENNALTIALLYSQGAILKFSLSSKKVEVIPIKKRLGMVNRITFDEQDEGGTWHLWFNGRLEAAIDDRVTGSDLDSEGK